MNILENKNVHFRIYLKHVFEILGKVHAAREDPSAADP